MKAPEKIYIVNDDLNIKREWYKTKQVGFETTEYIRTDAFIEEAQLFLIDKLKEIPMGSGKMKIKAECSLDEFIEDFKNYMKGESLRYGT